MESSSVSFANMNSISLENVLSPSIALTNAESVEPSTKKIPMLVSSFGALLYIVGVGFVYSYSAPSSVDMLRLDSRFKHLTTDQITWIASLPPLAAIGGNAASGYISHKLGRRAVLVYVATLFVLGWLIIAYAPSLPFVYAGRFISGFCGGICAVAVPAYIVEISTVQMRGFLTAGFQVAFSVGVCLVMLLGSVLRWSWLAIAGCAIVIVGACLMLFVPESPSWLAQNGKNRDALKALTFLRGKLHAPTELNLILGHKAEAPETAISWSEFLNPGLYRPALIALSLMFFQQFTGINCLMSYAVDLFKETKVALDPFVAAIIVSFVQLLGTCISSILMDRAGRKVLFMTSGLLISLSLLVLGIYSFYSRDYDTDELKHWSLVPLLSFMACIASYSVGFGPIPFVVIPEMVPTRLRSLILGIGLVSNSFFGFVITKVFADMRSLLGLSGVYWTYSAFTLLGFVFYCKFVPETKGKTVEEIHKQLSLSKK